MPQTFKLSIFAPNFSTFDFCPLTFQLFGFTPNFSTFDLCPKLLNFRFSPANFYIFLFWHLTPKLSSFSIYPHILLSFCAFLFNPKSFNLFDLIPKLFDTLKFSFSNFGHGRNEQFLLNVFLFGWFFWIPFLNFLFSLSFFRTKQKQIPTTSNVGMNSNQKEKIGLFEFNGPGFFSLMGRVNLRNLGCAYFNHSICMQVHVRMCFNRHLFS